MNKLLPSMLVFCLTVPYAAADDFTDAATDGQNTGMDILNTAPVPTNTGTGFGFTYQDGTAGSLSPEDMLPPTQSATTQQQDDYTDIQSSFMDDVSLTNAADAYTPDTTTSQGQAFEVVDEARNRSMPNLRNDPIWQTSDEVMANIDSFQQEFADCSLNNTLVDTTRTERITDYKYCEVMNVPLDTCTVYHDYSGVPPFSPAALDMSAYVVIPGDDRIVATPCGYGCVDFRFTQIQAARLIRSYSRGWMLKNGAYFDRAFRISLYDVIVIRPDLIQSVELIRYRYSFGRFFNIRINNPAPDALSPTKAMNYAYSSTGIDLTSVSDLSSFYYDLGTYPPIEMDMTGVIGNYGNNGEFTLEHKLQNNASTPVTVTYVMNSPQWGDSPEFVFRFRFDTTGLPIPPPLIEQWYPQGCIDAMNAAVNAPYCTEAVATCVEQTTTGSFTDPASGITYTESDLMPSPLPGVSNLCKRAQVTTRCPINEGQMDCYIDAQGIERCPQNDSSSNNTCLQYENDPQCAYIGETCMDDIVDPNTGNCMIFERQYDCGRDVEISSQAIQTTYDCPGPVRCFGEECILNTNESNTDFARVAATIDAVKYMAMDMDCQVGPGDAGDNCMVFAGEASECKKAVGGVQNCCESPSTPSMTDYLELMYAIYEVDKAAQALAGDNVLAGAWVAMTDPARQLWSSISEGASSLWTSAMESIVGGGTAGAELATASVADQATQDAVAASLSEQISLEVYNWVSETFNSEVASLFFSTTTDNATGVVTSAELGGTVGNAAGAVMTAYMYYQAAVVLIQLAYECEASEFELNAKRELQSTVYIGSYCRRDTLFGCIEKRQAYCAYSSPLAAIISEQAIPLLGRDFGTPRTPVCDGITLNELATLDWSQIDMSKWEAILQESGFLPDASDLTIDAITGSGNPINPYGDRQNTLERSVDRLNATSPDPELARDAIRQDILGQ